jgi:hypothetical protein
MGIRTAGVKLQPDEAQVGTGIRCNRHEIYRDGE